MVSSIEGGKTTLVVCGDLLQLHNLHLSIAIINAWNSMDGLVVSDAHLAAALTRLESLLRLVAHHQGLALLGLSFLDL